MSAGAIFRRILRRYGAEMVLYRQNGTVEGEGRALLQAVPDREEETIPSPLGLRKTGVFLCLAQPEEEATQAAYLSCGGKRYTVRSARPVRIGEELSHWRMILEERDEEKP